VWQPTKAKAEAHTVCTKHTAHAMRLCNCTPWAWCNAPSYVVCAWLQVTSPGNKGVGDQSGSSEEEASSRCCGSVVAPTGSRRSRGRGRRRKVQRQMSLNHVTTTVHHSPPQITQHCQQMQQSSYHRKLPQHFILHHYQLSPGALEIWSLVRHQLPLLQAGKRGRRVVVSCGQL